MALVEPHQYSEQLHGSIEMIEDSSQLPSTDSQANDEDFSTLRSFEQRKSDPETSKQNKDGIVLVTVKPLPISASSSQSSVPKSNLEEKRTTSIANDQDPVACLEAGRRRYSVMMASLAAARVEESKAALRLIGKASPGDATGVSPETAIDGWKWQTRRDLDDDFSMREKYFADEL